MLRRPALLLALIVLLSGSVGCWPLGKASSLLDLLWPPVVSDPPPFAEEDDQASNEAPNSDCQALRFKDDDEAAIGFTACFSAEGRIGSAPHTRNTTHELGLGADAGTPQNQADFAWVNGGEHAFTLEWDGAVASFTVDGVSLQDSFPCEPISALQLRCRANHGVCRLYDLVLNGEVVEETLEARSDQPGGRSDILRLECDLAAGFTLTGTAQLEWNTSRPPRNSQLAFQISAGTVPVDEPDFPDCNANGVPDDLDIAGGTSADCDGDGVPDECQPDTDGDGVIDPCDGCPDDPDKVEPGVCGCGIPDVDTDGDGTPDCQDECPDDPDKVEPGQCGCGVGDTDSDGDGTADCIDGCPDDPDKTEPGVCGCGVPDTDSDGDGVADCLDLCPDTPPGAEVDGFGCSDVVADAGEDVELDEVGPVVLYGSAVGGLPPYSYAWSAPGWDGATGPDVTVMPTETTIYTLTVTDQSDPPRVGVDTVTVTINPPPEVRYSIIDLGALSSGAVYPAGMNDSGEVVGYYYDDAGQKRAFLYRDGTLSDLGTLGGSEAYARDINNAGQVVGQARRADGNWRAFLWEPEHGMQDLGTLGGATSVAYAINELGQVVGYSGVGLTFHAFLYSDGQMGGLGTSGYIMSVAFDLNDQAQVVGTLVDWSLRSTAFLYDEGVLLDLGSPLLSDSQAWVINNAGLVAGYSWGSGQERSFLYAAGLVVDLGTLDGFPKTFVRGINDAGQLVGNVSDSSGSLSHAFVYTGGQLRDLNDWLLPEHDWESLTVAFAVNNAGQIAGYGKRDGQIRAFLLTPEP